MFRSFQIIIREFHCFLLKLLHIHDLFTDMVPQYFVYKNELNREYVITLATNDETPWWWSEKIEKCRSGFKWIKVF